MSADRRAVTCDGFEAEAAELALGQLDDPRRSELLDHAAGCARCGSVLADLSAVCDRLLHFAPQIEPPTGFEARAVARMGPARPRRSGRSALGVAAAGLAAAVLLIVGVVIGRAGSDGSDRNGPGFRAATAGSIVTDDGESIGTVELEDGPVGRVVLTLDGAQSWEGIWTCELEVGGRWVEVGRWTADEVTNHVWAAGIAPGLTDATSMRILGASGAVIASADLDVAA